MADWDDLRIFLAVARSESLSAAGRALRLDAATVGRRIARLEVALGAALFRRSAQGYALTEAGGRLLPEAARAEAAMLSALGAVRGEAADGLAGQVRIGAPDGCATWLLPGVVAGVAAANPRLEIQIVALPRVFNLSKREADMAITVSPPAAGRLMAQRVTAYRLILAASPAYLAARPPLSTRADLRGHRVIGYIPDMIFDPELDYLAEIGVEAPHVASNAVTVQFGLIRAGAGIGFVHAFALPSAPDLVRVLPDVALTRAFWLIRHADDRRDARLSAIAAALAEGLRRAVAAAEAAIERA